MRGLPDAFRLAIVALLVLFAAGANAQIITTIAGTDFHFPTGPLAAVDAPLGPVGGVAVDPLGNVFIVDPQNSRVFQVTPTGSLQVVAGNGIQGFSGDGGPAASASLNFPEAVAVDSTGNIYICGTGNSRVRKVSNGIITTVAGNGNYTFSGDGGPATEASLDPEGVAVDSAGNLYIADAHNYRIRRVTNGTITTFAGGALIQSFGSGPPGDGGPAVGATLVFPTGVAVDSAANLYIADRGLGYVRKVLNGIITTVAVDSLFEPQALAVDVSGNVYIADSGNNRVRKVSNGIITAVAGGGIAGFTGDGSPAVNAALNFPLGVAVDRNGNVYIADYGNSRIRKVANGIISTFAGNGQYRFSGDGGPASSGSLSSPGSIGFDGVGNLYFSDGGPRIRKISNGTIETIAGNGNPGFSGDGGPATTASFSNGRLAVDAGGNVYIADYFNNRVRKISNGLVTTVCSR